MPSTCCAIGCRTGYRGEEKQPDVALHRFPLNKPELLQCWLRNLHREDFTPTEHTRICSLHFNDDDYEGCTRMDANSWRSRKRGHERKVRLLKADAVPHIFSGMPAYLSKETPKSRSQSATSSFRAKQMEFRHEDAETDFWDSDRVENYAEIEERLKSGQGVPAGFCTVKNDTCLALCFIEFDHANIPVLKGSITICETMEFAVICLGKPIPAESFSEIVTTTITKFSQLTNLMASLKSLITGDQRVPWILLAIDCLERAKSSNESEDESLQKIAFLSEQLQTSENLLTIAIVEDYCTPALEPLGSVSSAGWHSVPFANLPVFGINSCIWAVIGLCLPRLCCNFCWKMMNSKHFWSQISPVIIATTLLRFWLLNSSAVLLVIVSNVSQKNVILVPVLRVRCEN